MGGLFGGGSDNQTVTTQTKLPEWADKGGESLFNAAAGLAARPYPTYGGPRIAGFNPDQQSAFELVRNSAGEWLPTWQEAKGMTAGAGAPVTAADTARYMNPYTEDVVGNVVKRMNEEYGRQAIQRTANLSARGSRLNEDRRAILEGVDQQKFNDTMAQALANLYSSGFDKAFTQANTDKARGLAAGGQTASLATMMPQLRGVDIGNLLGVGGQQQGQTQANLSLAYQDFLNQFNYPQEQLNWVNAVLRGLPTSSTTTQTQPVGTANPWAQALGLVGTGLGVAGNFGAFG